MHELNVQLGSRAYPIHIGEGLLEDPRLWASFGERPRLLVTDATVADLYLERVASAAGLTPADTFRLTPGEREKSWDNAEALLDTLLERRMPRDGVLIALGGGVIGDLTGFCAAIYQRGIDFVQVPTTLLAQVDSSVGGKTAVNHPRGKNMIGAFHQPVAVLADTGVLRSLPRRELLAGVAEVIKYGLLGDIEFLGWLEARLDALLALDPAVTAETVAHCCRMKAAIVAEDERESLGSGVRARLNLGHTFGHAIETYTGYTHWLHGEAVATGMVMAADCSARLGWLTPADARRVHDLIARAGLPVKPPAGMQPAHFMDLMAHDKKVAGGRLRLVLLKRLGEAVLSADFDPAALRDTLTAATA